MTPSRADAEKAVKIIRDYCESKEECEGCFMFNNCHSRYGDVIYPEYWVLGDRK